MNKMPLVSMDTIRAVAADSNDPSFYQKVLEEWRDHNPAVLHVIISYAQGTKSPFEVIFACMMLWMSIKSQIGADRLSSQLPKLDFEPDPPS